MPTFTFLLWILQLKADFYSLPSRCHRFASRKKVFLVLFECFSQGLSNSRNGFNGHQNIIMWNLIVHSTGYLQYVCHVSQAHISSGRIWTSSTDHNGDVLSETSTCTFNQWLFTRGCSKRFFLTFLDACWMSEWSDFIGWFFPSERCDWSNAPREPGQSEPRVIEPRHDKNSSRNQ